MSRIPAPLASLLAFAALAAGCRGAGAPAATSAAARVEVSRVVPAPEQETVELDGTVAPSQTADLVARVPGVLTGVLVPDGQPVRRGQLLFTIERDSYEQQVKLNEAKLAQARSDDERQRQLLAENATSRASVDSSVANDRQAEANLALARINLGYTEVRAPFDGVLGRHQADVGNYVGAAASGTVLGTVMRISPAFVNASIAEADLQALRRRAERGELGPRAGAGGPARPLRVQASLPGDDAPPEVGVLDFIDHQLAAGSGTLSVRARFPNAQRRLLPGNFVHLSIALGEAHDAIVLAADAVRADLQGELVWVVDASGVCHRRAVRTRALPGERREVVAGLSAGEAVVVAGYDALRDGMHVQAAAAQR